MTKNGRRPEPGVEAVLRQGWELFPGEEPDREKKERFLQGLPGFEGERLDFGRMVLLQAGYIHKGVWITGVLLVAVLLLCVRQRPALQEGTELAWLTASLTPLLAMSAELELHRSRRFRMAELESAAPFSLRSIRYARFIVLGLFDLGVLLFLAVLLGPLAEVGTALMLARLSVPYFAAMTGALLTERSPFARRYPYLPPMAVAAVSAGALSLSQVKGKVMGPEYNGIWEAAALCLMAATAVLFHTNTRREEAMGAWS